MPRRLDPSGARSRTLGQENGKKVDKRQKSSATPVELGWLVTPTVPLDRATGTFELASDRSQPMKVQLEFTS